MDFKRKSLILSCPVILPEIVIAIAYRAPVITKWQISTAWGNEHLKPNSMNITLNGVFYGMREICTIFQISSHWSMSETVTEPRARVSFRHVEFLAGDRWLVVVFSKFINPITVKFNFIELASGWSQFNWRNLHALFFYQQPVLVKSN